MQHRCKQELLQRKIQMELSENIQELFAYMDDVFEKRNFLNRLHQQLACQESILEREQWRTHVQYRLQRWWTGSSLQEATIAELKELWSGYILQDRQLDALNNFKAKFKIALRGKEYCFLFCSERKGDRTFCSCTVHGLRQRTILRTPRAHDSSVTAACQNLLLQMGFLHVNEAHFQRFLLLSLPFRISLDAAEDFNIYST